MRKILKRPLALSDIKGIWRYSFTQWGEAQADRYLLAMEQALIKLAETPQLGRKAHHPVSGLYQYHFQKHLIIYMYNDTSLDIVRILHQRMDVYRHAVQ